MILDILRIYLTWTNNLLNILSFNILIFFHNYLSNTYYVAFLIEMRNYHRNIWSDSQNTRLFTRDTRESKKALHNALVYFV